jgi:hypothetical protein
MATGSMKLASRRQSPAQLKEMMMGERKHGLYTLQHDENTVSLISS